MKKIILLSISILHLGCSSCKKSSSPAPDNQYGLPNATQTGANVLACQINGQNFISYYKLGITGAQLDSGNIISVFGTKSYSNFVFTNLGFRIKNPIQGAVYTNIDSSALLRFISDSTCQGYASPSVNLFASKVQVTISKFDKLRKIISGTFSSQIPIPNCDTLNITDGRFDFNYY